MADVLQQYDEVGAMWSAGANAPKSLPAPAIVGSRICVVLSLGDGTGTASFSGIVDDGATDYALCKRQQDGTLGCNIEIWSGIATSVDAGQGVVATPSATSASADDLIGLYEVGDPEPEQVFDASNTNGSAAVGGVTTHDSGDVTTVIDGAVLIGMSRGGSGVYTVDPTYVNDLTNSRSTLAHREQPVAGVDDYVVTSVDNEFVVMVITAFESAAAGTGPVIGDVDGDDTITSTQTGWEINGSLFDNATVEIRQGAVEMAQDVNSQDADTINCDTVFDPGAPGNGPHLKYGAADAFVINADLEEDSIAITIDAPAGRAYVDVVDPNPTADNRITAVADIETGDQLEIFGVVGGTIADVTVNPDATFDCGEDVMSFQVRCWDAGDSTWGAAGTQTPGSIAPVDSGNVVGPGVSSSAVVGSLGVSP